ncbi:MAG: TraB/GumN family protein [Pseudomonadota bacterium]
MAPFVTFRMLSKGPAAALACLPLAFAFLVAQPSPQAAAQASPAACTGKDLLAEIKAANPDAYAAIVRKGKRVPNTEAMLWKVTKKGSTAKPSYLFGTIHLTDDRVTTLSDKTKAALSASDVLAVEVADMSQDALAKVIAASPQLLVFTNGQSLDKLLSPQDFKSTTAALKGSGIPAAVARQFKPWFVMTTLAQTACERTRIQSGLKVLDNKLVALAKAKTKKVVGLETAREQLAAMASIPMPQQVKMLRASLAYASRNQDMIETMLRMYMKRDMGKTWPLQFNLAKKIGISEREYDGFRQRIEIKRNYLMRDRSLPLLSNGGAFIAVGALHVVGAEGLVRLYRNAGYTVTPIE